MLYPVLVHEHGLRGLSGGTVKKDWWTRTDWDTLDLGVRELDCQIIEGKQSMEGLGDKLNLSGNSQLMRSYT